MSIVLDPWDLSREEEEQDMSIEQLRENMSWDDEGLPVLELEDKSEYIDRKYAQQYEAHFG